MTRSARIASCGWSGTISRPSGPARMTRTSALTTETHTTGVSAERRTERSRSDSPSADSRATK